MEGGPEKHTLVLLREMRHDDAEFRRDVVARLERIETKLEVVSKVASGESVLGRYTAAQVQG